ncbi:MAG: NAD-dependent epimerase [Betaproteobacteria bacterium]|nr:NAD-dependent epimerase [Betaproteobacteria bacterium]
MKILVTGAAGFIGFHLVRALLRRGDEVTGVDNLNDYYEVSLKQARLRQIEGQPRFRFHRLDIADRLAMKELFALEWFDAVANLAAQPGVRHSLVNPSAYVDSNLVGFGNVLEGCRQQQVKHLVFASSSSVYGANNRIPYSEHDAVDHPISLYAATKRANELMAHTYAHLYGLPATGLRFFTVYGPWGRPDMAYFSFTRKILAGGTIPLFNRGDMMRDFTYIDDIVEGVVRVMDRAPERSGPEALGSPATALAPFRLYNIGNSQPVALAQFMETLESALGRKAMTELQPMQPGDVEKTCADTTDLERATGFRPRTPIAEGIAKFVAWYRSYYGQ